MQKKGTNEAGVAVAEGGEEERREAFQLQLRRPLDEHVDQLLGPVLQQRRQGAVHQLRIGLLSQHSQRCG